MATRLAAPGATVRRLLGDIDAEAAPVVEVLRQGIEAADATARPLFAGLTAEPWPQDVAAQLVHACHLLREHRGDSHLAVCALAGLDPVEMNILTALYCGYEPLTYTATRGWTHEQMTEALERLRGRGLVSGSGFSDEGLRFRHHLEAQTDAMQQSIIDAVGSHLDSHIKQLDAWSNALIAAGGAPPIPPDAPLDSLDHLCGSWRERGLGDPPWKVGRRSRRRPALMVRAGIGGQMT